MAKVTVIPSQKLGPSMFIKPARGKRLLAARGADVHKALRRDRPAKS